MPSVSVVVPVYKAEQYLCACIDSILAQSFSDIEVILVDDGSPDKCPMICDMYAAQDPRVRVIHQQNQGQAAARNRGVAQARGEWICFVDSDDLIHPQMLQRLYSAVMESGLMISMCENQEAMSPSEDFYQSCDESFSIVTMDEDTWVSLYDANRYPCWVIWAKLIHRDIILKYPFCEGRIYEDNAVVCYWFYASGKIAYVPEKMYFYRVNPNGTTKSEFSIKRLDCLWALEEIIRFCRYAGFPQLQERFCSHYLMSAYWIQSHVQKQANRKYIIRKIRRDTLAFFKKERVILTKKQIYMLLDIVFPTFATARELIYQKICQIRNKG